EARLGIEIDSRVFAYLRSSNAELDRALGLLGPVAGDARQWRFGAVYSMLWPRGWTVRAQGLPARNPYAELAPTDRELVLKVVGTDPSLIDVDSTDWNERAAAALVSEGEVLLFTSRTRLQNLRAAVLTLMREPVDV